MNKPNIFFFLGIFLLIFIFFNGFAQKKINLELLDSLQLQCPSLQKQPNPWLNIQLFNERYYLLESNSSILHIFNQKGECTEEFFVYRPFDKNMPLKPSFFQVTDDRYYFAKNLNSRVVIFSKKGEFISNTLLELKGWNKDFISQWNAYPLFFINPLSRQVFLSIVECVMDDNGKMDREKSSLLKAKNEFYTNPILAVFPLDGLETTSNKDSAYGLPFMRPNKLIGFRDAICSTFPLLDKYFLCLNPNTKNIFLSEEATHRIKVFDTDGKLVKTFGNKGMYLKDGDTAISYGHIYDEHNQLLTFRIYNDTNLQVYDNKNRDSLIADKSFNHIASQIIYAVNDQLYIYREPADTGEMPEIYFYKLSFW